MFFVLRYGCAELRDGLIFKCAEILVRIAICAEISELFLNSFFCSYLSTSDFLCAEI